MAAERCGALISSENVDAVIGVDDSAALAAMRVSQQLGIEIPEKIQIIGIDDSVDASRAIPSLATFRQPLAEMAACAVDLAMGRRVRSRKFAATFVAGGSVRECQISS